MDCFIEAYTCGEAVQKQEHSPGHSQSKTFLVHSRRIAREATVGRHSLLLSYMSKRTYKRCCAQLAIKIHTTILPENMRTEEMKQKKRPTQQMWSRTCVCASLCGRVQCNSQANYCTSPEYTSANVLPDIPLPYMYSVVTLLQVEQHMIFYSSPKINLMDHYVVF